MLKEKRDFIIQKLKDTVGTSKYLLVVNGEIRKHRGSAVYVKLVEDQLEFFTRARVGASFVEDVVPELREAVLSEIGSSILFGLWDFTEYAEKELSKIRGFHLEMSVDTMSNILYVETDMYSVVRKNIMNRPTNNIGFKPTMRGQTLEVKEIVALRTQFNMRAFSNILELVQARYLTSVRKNTSKFFKIDNIFVPAMIRGGAFNPFFDDEIISSQVKNTKLFRLMADNVQKVRYSDLSVSYLTNLQISKALGLKVLMPFNFQILYRLLIGFVMRPEDIGYTFPHREKRCYRLQTLLEGFDTFLTEEEYLSRSEDVQEHYVPTTTYNQFFIQNIGFYRRNKFGNLNALLDVMRTATLV